MGRALEIWFDMEARPMMLRCRGQLDSGTVEALISPIGGLLASRPITLVVDIGGLVVADETGGRYLASIESAARRSGTTVFWCGVDRLDLPQALSALGATVLTSFTASSHGPFGAWSERVLRVEDPMRLDPVEAFA